MVMGDEQRAKVEMSKSIRDLLTLKMTVPLGNPELNKVHTNQFIYCYLGEDLFNLSQMDNIAKQLSGYARTSNYKEGKWYVEGVTINNDGNKFNMELTLNPFASAVKSYVEKRQSFEKAWTSAQENTGSGGGADNKTVKSTGNSGLKGGQGEVIDNLVKGICGNISGELDRCKAIHEWLRNNVIYSNYECCRYCTPEKAYNNRSHINCADTAVLTCSMMLSAGLNAYIVHRPYNGGHFWTIIEIDGKKYASDQTGRESAGMSGSAFNTVWSHSGRSNTSITDYGHRESGFNTC